MQLITTKSLSVALISSVIVSTAGLWGGQSPVSAAPKHSRALQKHVACKTPNKEATTSNQVPPDYPEGARAQGPATVSVQVTIGPSGKLLTAKILKSSNSMLLDQAALSAARRSSYTPKIVNCKPTVGTYIFKGQFDPNQ